MPIKSQKGSSIVEAVIAMILLSIIAQRAVFLSSRAAATQGEKRVQEIVVHQMRSALLQNGSLGNDICMNPPVIQLPNNNSVTAQVQGCAQTTEATIDGSIVSGIPQPISLSVTSDAAGGQVVVGGTWTQ